MGEHGPQTEWRPLKVKILNYLAELGIVDKIAQKRAVDIIEKTKVLEHLKPNGTYLDIGSGIGHIVEKISNEKKGGGVKFLAIDPKWNALHKVRRRLGYEGGDYKKLAGGKKSQREPSPVLFLRAEGGHLPLADKSVDGVSLFFVLHHVPPENEGQIFDEIKRVLKDDGSLFLTEDTPEGEDEKEANARWDIRMNPDESKHEKHYYRGDTEWIEFLQKNGFEIIDTHYFEDISSRKAEGVIRHHSYILKRTGSPKAS